VRDRPTAWLAVGRSAVLLLPTVRLDLRRGDYSSSIELRSYVPKTVNFALLTFFE
jgi:hypothetical protein